MVSKQISNPSQAWTAGASWGTPSIDNEMSQEVIHLINGTGQNLYTGDIVCMDVTGTQAVLAAANGDPRIIGVVGGAENWGSYASPTSLSGVAGSAVPAQLAPTVVANMAYTNGSATVIYAGAAAGDIGKQLIPAYNSTTNPTPQVLTITAVSVGVSYTVNANFTGTTGAFATALLLAPSSIGPGYQPLTINPQSEVPIIIRGLGRVNINGVTAVVATDAIQATNASVVGARTANGSLVAGQIGQSIATTLEAYAARDTTLTGLGITGHDTVRAIIGKF